MTREDVIKKEFQTKINVFDEYQKLTDNLISLKKLACELVIRYAEKHKEFNFTVPQRIIDYSNRQIDPSV